MVRKPLAPKEGAALALGDILRVKESIDSGVPARLAAVLDMPES